MENEIIIITLLVLNLIGTGLAIITKSYLGKKAENLATKQDIGKITHEVEKVKNEFIKDHEILKTNLSIFISSQLESYKEERNALLLFYEAYLNWRERALDISKSHLDYFPENTVSQIRNELDEAFQEVNIAETRLSFFVQNDDLILYANRLTKETLELDGKAHKALVILGGVYEELNDLYSKPDHSIEEGNRMKQLIAKDTEIIKQYEADKTANYKVTIGLLEDYAQNAKQYLRNNNQKFLT